MKHLLAALVCVTAVVAIVRIGVAVDDGVAGSDVYDQPFLKYRTPDHITHFCGPIVIWFYSEEHIPASNPDADVKVKLGTTGATDLLYRSSDLVYRGPWDTWTLRTKFVSDIAEAHEFLQRLSDPARFVAMFDMRCAKRIECKYHAEIETIPERIEERKVETIRWDITPSSKEKEK